MIILRPHDLNEVGGQMSDDNSDDKLSKAGLRLVADNDPSQIAKNAAEVAANAAKLEATQALAQLVSNLLRVIAGAGQPDRMIPDLQKALLTWQEWTNQLGYRTSAIPEIDR